MVAEFLLLAFNHFQHTEYIKFYNLSAPVDSLQALLIQQPRWRTETVLARDMVNRFRKGEFGKTILDQL